jgi:hypothetical protein
VQSEELVPSLTSLSSPVVLPPVGKLDTACAVTLMIVGLPLEPTLRELTATLPFPSSVNAPSPDRVLDVPEIE